MTLIAALPTMGAEMPVFEKDVRPILKTHCFHCHGEDGVTKGDLDVRLRRFLVKGGESGPALLPGDSVGSHLLELVKSGEMPKEKKKLSDAEIATIERWIVAGAPTARPEPETLGPEHQFTEEERAWWSLQPISKPAVPESSAKKGSNPIDAFVARKLAENDLDFSAEASPEVLIRRATFDLTGLPPTPEAVEAFAAAWKQDADAAYSKMIDGLMASTSYGERWGRHWLDVAGYADSDGYTDKDLERKHSWKYRDYVIASLNDDKPFDGFVREQLAGDEIAELEGLNPDSPTEAEKARYAELLTATGFLRMAPDGTGAQNDLAARNACITDTLKIVSTAFYGMTLQCAECHDHRYDPITQADFYRLRAIFEPGFDPVGWRTPNNRLVSLQTKEDKAKAAEIEAEAKKIDDARLVKQEEFINEVLEKELAKRDEAIREPLRAAYKTVVKDRTPEQIALLKQHPSVEKLGGGSLYLYDTTYKTSHAATLKKMVEEATAVRATKPVVEMVQAFTEVPKKPEAVPATFLFHRGDFESPKEKVVPGDLSVLAGWRTTDLPENTAALPSTGRRLALAEALTDGRHPLLARVMVNRVWMHHFGTGLVKSVADFGALGETPSHPELLDWLTSDFMENGWSLKRLHRQILTSQTWRQTSQRDTERDSVDPDNRLLSRQNKRRLEAETLRDSLLAVSGTLNPKVGGNSVPVMYSEEGQVVIGVDTTDTAGRQTGNFISLEGEEFRRSVYVQVRRSQPLELFAAFDAPDMTNANCEIRPITTVSPQSLLLMNNAGMLVHAQYFAERLQKECPKDDIVAQAKRAWQLAYGRAPSDDELASAVAFVTEQTAYYRENPVKREKVVGPAEKDNAPAELMGLAALGHALMSANEFFYLD